MMEGKTRDKRTSRKREWKQLIREKKETCGSVTKERGRKTKSSADFTTTTEKQGVKWHE